jgi:hypothetical protein
MVSSVPNLFDTRISLADRLRAIALPRITESDSFYTEPDPEEAMVVGCLRTRVWHGRVSLSLLFATLYLGIWTTQMIY